MSPCSAAARPGCQSPGPVRMTGLAVDLALAAVVGASRQPKLGWRGRPDVGAAGMDRARGKYYKDGRVDIKRMNDRCFAR